MEDFGKKDEDLFRNYYLIARDRIQAVIVGLQKNREDQNNILDTAVQRLYELNSSGKRLRGTLAYIGYDMMTHSAQSADRMIPNHKADMLAAAFELFQTSILIHDDIIDNAEFRRGMPTIHSQYCKEMISAVTSETPEFQSTARKTAEAIAVCIGDIGFYTAEQYLAEAYNDSSCFGRLASYYHKMLLHTIQGELLDVQAPCMEKYDLWAGFGLKQPDSMSMVQDIYHLKTSCYTVIGPLCSGMILGGATDAQIAQMEDVADRIGKAFQIQDDIAGIFAERETTGKDVGSDISEFKQTILFAYVKERGGEDYEKLLRYYGSKQLSESGIERIRDIFRRSGALDFAVTESIRLYSSAHEQLELVEGISEDKKSLLHGFISWLSKK